MEPRHAAPLDHARSAPPLAHDAAFQRAMGDPAGERVVIIGHDTLDPMCAMIRAGAAEVTLLRLGERPEPEEADLAILVGLASAPEASRAIMQARRALAPTGRVVIAATTMPLAGEIASMLRGQGFAGVRSVRDGTGATVRGEVPYFAPLGSLVHG